jgi:hypothetical protein
MARHRPRGTLVDYLVAAIEPALIIIMVGSLMFFLLDIWYPGPFLERLRWILFWFVLGIVLITRVSMQIGSSLAMGYGVALGGAVALVASVLAGFHPFLLVILGVVWWATHKLTFDCTLLDEDQDAGVGLLQQSGLDPSALADPVAPPTTTAPTDDPAAMDASLLPHRPWWKLGQGDSDAARRPHAPGVWLVYFTLASLPLFGLGQWFVPAVEEERRAGLFLYFLAYIASGMGLLLATSFLNLRRYLRRRSIRMPAAMTATWLSTGAILIAGLTALAAIVPLPLAGSALSAVRDSSRESTDLRASRLAVLKDSGVQGEGAPSEGPAASKATGRPASSSKAKGSGQANDPNAAAQTSGKGRPGGTSGPGRAKSGTPRGRSSPSQAGTPGKRGSPQDQAQAGNKAKSQDGRSQNQADRGKEGSPPDQAGDQAKGQDGRSEDQADRGKDSNPGDKNEGEGEKKDENASRENQQPSDASNPPSRLPSLPFQAPSWLRTLVIAAMVVALVFGLFRYGPALFQALWDLLASLLGGLWITKREKPKKDQAPTASEPAVPPRPFASFVNPFDSGLAQRFSPDELVVYSFEALEAWASEHNLARSSHETPSEFVRRLGQARADLRPDATRLVGFFVAIVYGQRGFQAEVLPPLRQFWRALQGQPA